MSILQINNVKIIGISSCVPKKIEENISLTVFTDQKEAQKVIDSTGIERKRIVAPGTTASDLAYQSVNELLDAIEWDRHSIDCVVFLSIMRDYVMPSTAAVLQGRLGFREDCFCIDMSLGCAGWNYGLSTIASLLSHGNMKRGLLICAETTSLNHNRMDKTVAPLFGDAGTVTALEYDANWSKPMFFSYGVRGNNFRTVWAEYGGSRNPETHESLEEKEVEKGIIRKGSDVIINGMDLFAFAIKVPTNSLKQLIEDARIDVNNIDYLVLHQSNHFIDERIRKKLNLPVEKVPYCLKDFGNTSDASIPLTMSVCCADKLMSSECNILTCGFGTGLLWSSGFFSTENLRAVLLTEFNEENIHKY